MSDTNAGVSLPLAKGSFLHRKSHIKLDLDASVKVTCKNQCLTSHQTYGTARPFSAFWFPRARTLRFISEISFDAAFQNVDAGITKISNWFQETEVTQDELAIFSI
jgi:hypothetical protein